MTTVTRPKTKLRSFLDERGIRYVWVAGRLGITKAHLHQVMEGNRPLTERHANALAEIFGVPASTFLPEAQ